MIYLQACRHTYTDREREREITTAHECRDLTHAKVKKLNNTNTWVLIKFPHTGVIGTLSEVINLWQSWTHWASHLWSHYCWIWIGDCELIFNFSEITTTCLVSKLRDHNLLYMCLEMPRSRRSEHHILKFKKKSKIKIKIKIPRFYQPPMIE
jgi:hypothetical protein